MTKSAKSKSLPDVAELTKAKAKVEVKRLTLEIEKHNALYHQKNAPKISDAEYDSLRRRLAAIEHRFPDLANAGSPSKQVGASPVRIFARVRHSIPMLSLENAFSEDEVKDFIEQVRKPLDLTAEEFPSMVAEPKIDGLSLSLRYKNGMLLVAATRGDGEVGEDVTANVRMIDDIPPILLGGNIPAICEVRGEVYMLKEDFIALNRKQEEAGEELFANPRNSAAGSLRQKDPSITKSRALRFFAYTWGEMSEMPSGTQFGMMRWLKSVGFKTNPMTKSCETMDELIDFYRRVEEQRAELPYDIDGVVYKVDRLDWQDRLGFREQSPRWAVAHKFPPEQATTILEKIDIQVGRTGALTPVARLTGVTVGGVFVQNATLHNEDEIARKDIREGDTVIVQRAGDVIPQVVGVVRDKRSPSAKAFRFPRQCPICGSSAVRDEDEGEATRRCTGGLTCPAQAIERLRHFVSRSALDIEGFGETYVQLLFDEGLVRSPSDIFLLHKKVDQLRAALFRKREMLAKKREEEKGQKRKKSLSEEERQYNEIDNLLAAIEARRSVSLNRLLYALGIRHVGEVTARALAKHFSTIPALRRGVSEAAVGRPGPAWSELEGIPGIGPVTMDGLLRERGRLSTQLNLDLDGPKRKAPFRLSNKQRESLLEHYGSVASIEGAIKSAHAQAPKAAYQHLASDSDIGPVATDHLIDFFEEPHNEAVVAALDQQVRIKKPEIVRADSVVSGKIIVFTGALEKMTRDAAKAKAISLGAKTSESVSSKTDYVVAGPGAGSKLVDAKKNGVAVLTEDEWLKLIGE